MRFFYVIILLVVHCFNLSVVAQDIIFRHLSTTEDLSHYSVMSIYQDPKGLIWIGTRNGVNLYDGHEISVFKHDQNDEYSICSNYVRDITGDEKGMVYFLTIRGISAFEPKSERFLNLIQNNVSAMHYNDQLFIALGNSVYVYDGDRFNQVYSLPAHDVQITCLYVDKTSMFIGTREEGCYLYDRNSKELRQLFDNEEIIKIFKDSKGRYWIGTLNDGLYLFSENGLHHYSSLDGLCANYVRDICEDKQGDIWIGTFRGLNKYMPLTDNFISYPNTSRNMLASSTSVWSLLCDNQGNIWIGTYFGGVDFFNPSQSIYWHYNASEHEGAGLSVPIVGVMVEDINHNIWISTEGGGLNKLDTRTGQFSWYRYHEGGNSISQNNVKTVFFDKQRNCLWIGTHLGGLNKLDINSGHFTHYSYHDQVSHKSNIICDIIPYKDLLLLATHDGVYQFNPETAVFIPLFKEGQEGDIISFALDLCIDHRGILWIAGAEKGAYAYDFVTKRLKLYSNQKQNPHSLSSNGVNCIYEDMGNRLWLCTAESGLDLYQEETDSFINYSEATHELLSNCVYGACSDTPDKLFIITDRGLSCLDISTQQITNYSVGKSLPLSAINQNAIFRASDGRMYIGGVDGLLTFYPQQLELQSLSYQIFPFKLFINDKQVQIGDETGLLKESLRQTEQLTFNASQSMFSIQYAITNYSSFNQDNIVYRLENFSDSWTTLRNGRIITYTNLEPGNYQLVVKAVGKDGEEKACNRINIKILPPLYKTWWAYLLYVISASLIITYIVRTYNKRLKLQTELKYERNYIKDIEELNQSKLRFFTNISHEFRTPLTIIIGQMEMLLQVKNIAPMVYNKILRTYKSSLQLQELINELLDFRKQEQGQMKVKVSEHNIVEFLHATYLLFQEYATTRNINFKFNKSNDVINVWYDAKQLQKVVNNLLSNAFKYTPNGGEISLSVAKRGHEVVVDVADNGCGIPIKEQNNIFNRFYQTAATLSSQNAGSGIGLALAKGIVELHHGTIGVISVPDEGSTFSFSIPLGNSHFKPEEISQNKESDFVRTPHENMQQIEIMEQETRSMSESDVEKKFKIVLVEDDIALRDMLIELFTPYYHVIAVSNGKDGLDAVKEHMPDIVLSDVLLEEGMTGIELCREIKRNIETCHIPVVLLTACTAIEYKLEGIQTGADDYITKPFDINVLLARCKNLVNNRIVLQEKFSKQPQNNFQMIATNPLDMKFVEQAMQVIEKHIGDSDFSMNDFAREMCIARTKLFIKLKAITGRTPNDLILTVRLHKAAILLKNNPEYNIANISTILGFSSPRYFSRYFKDKYGVTPQIYRRKDVSPNREQVEAGSEPSEAESAEMEDIS